MPNLKTYDKSAVFHAEVMPLLQKLTALCQEHDLPVASVVAFGYDDGKSKMSVLAGGNPQRTPRALTLLVSLLNDGYETFDEAMSTLDRVLSGIKQAREVRLN